MKRIKNTLGLIWDTWCAAFSPPSRKIPSELKLGDWRDDAKALRGDWERVGEDLRKAMHLKDDILE